MKLKSLALIAALLFAGATRAQTVAKPDIKPASGPFTGNVTVTITDATPGAIIYYTTDGKTPTTLSKKYTGPFVVHAAAIIKAFAVLNPSTMAYVVYFAVPPGHTVTLGWAAPSSSPLPVASYNIYRGSASGAESTKINTAPVTAVSFVDRPAAGTYFYIVKSATADGTESIPSNEAQAIVP